MVAAQWVLGRPGWYALPASAPFLGLGDTVYRKPKRPRAMDGATAAVLCEIWDAAGAESEARRATARRIEQTLDGARTLARVEPIPEAVPGYLRYPVLSTRAQALRPVKALGMMAGYPKSLADLEGFERPHRHAAGKLFPGARDLADRLITLPTHRWIGAAELAAFRAWARED